MYLAKYKQALVVKENARSFSKGSVHDLQKPAYNIWKLNLKNRVRTWLIRLVLAVAVSSSLSPPLPPPFCMDEAMKVNKK